MSVLFLLLVSLFQKQNTLFPSSVSVSKSSVLFLYCLHIHPSRWFVI